MFYMGITNKRGGNDLKSPEQLKDMSICYRRNRTNWVYFELTNGAPFGREQNQTVMKPPYTNLQLCNNMALQHLCDKITVTTQVSHVCDKRLKYCNHTIKYKCPGMITTTL